MKILRNKEYRLKLILELLCLFLVYLLFKLPGILSDISYTLNSFSCGWRLAALLEKLHALFLKINKGLNTGGMILLLGFVFILIDYLFAVKRYEKLEKLSLRVDDILHGRGEGDLSVSEYEEGELSILSSEIRKMTIRINEQTESLRKDKVTLSDAIADIFHQLRTPLTSLNLTADLLREENISVEKRIMLARDVKKQLERIQWLVETLLKLSKIDANTAAFEKKPVDVFTLCQKSLEPFEILMELRGIDLEMKIDHNAGFMGDFAWSTEAISNLIKNCLEHTPDGGTIRVEAAENPIYTEIVISDSGEGFDKEDIPHLFERFYKGKNASPYSIGIGLALCRSIIISQNGTISAKNHDKGAQFDIRFYKTVV